MCPYSLDAKRGYLLPGCSIQRQRTVNFLILSHFSPFVLSRESTLKPIKNTCKYIRTYKRHTLHSSCSSLLSKEPRLMHGWTTFLLRQFQTLVVFLCYLRVPQQLLSASFQFQLFYLSDCRKYRVKVSIWKVQCFEAIQGLGQTNKM